jgi:hypothetical protein
MSIQGFTKIIDKRGRGGNRIMKNNAVVCGGFGAAFWLAGWLFTMAITNPVWWKAILGIIVWPFYLGDFVLALP